MSRRGRRGVGAVWARHDRRRARVAVFAAAVLLLVTAPSTSPFRSPPAAPPLAADAALGAPIEELRARAGTVPVGIAAQEAVAPAIAAADEVAIAPPPATFDAPAASSAPPPALLTRAAATQAGGVWAVVIGIDDYPGSGSDLRQSVRDANDVDSALAAYGIPAERRLLVRDRQASAAVIVDSLRWLVSRAGPDATAVFFYAGHVRKLGPGSEAIVAADGGLVTDRRVAEVLRPLAARQAWIALASCYAGGFDEVLAPGRILTGAAGANSLAYENSRYGNSYLVEYMVGRAMLEGQAAASIEQSYAWAYDALRRDHPDRLPVQYDRLDGDLRLGPPPVPTSQPAPAPPAPSEPPPSQDAPPPSPPPENDSCVLTIGSLVGCGEGTTVL